MASKNKPDVEKGRKSTEKSKGKSKERPKKKKSSGGCCRCCRRNKKEEEEEKGLFCCRAGVCRRWYCLSNLCLLPLFWLITLPILAHSIYYALDILLGKNFEIWTQLFFWSVVGTSFFLVLLVQVTYIVVLFDLKYKCGKLWFWILFTITFLCIITTIVSLSFLISTKKSQLSAPPKGSGNAKVPKGSGNVKVPKGKTLTEGNDEDEDDEDAETVLPAGTETSNHSQPIDEDTNPANENKTDDENDKVSERRKRQNERSVKERQPRAAALPPPPSGSGKPKSDFFDDTYKLLKQNFVDLLKHPNPLIPTLYTVLMFLILTLVLHIFLYYCCKSNGEKEGSQGCKPSGTSEADTSTQPASGIWSEDVANANLDSATSSFRYHDCKALLSKKYSWSPPGTATPIGSNTDSKKKKKSKVKVFYFKI